MSKPAMRDLAKKNMMYTIKLGQLPKKEKLDFARNFLVILTKFYVSIMTSFRYSQLNSVSHLQLLEEFHN
ncbi:hypothetical protein BpHYR1_002612 [Brachionus plicatilis]|uniref:Uncharacterized protein n=1 Tax=Brachionus plicatilis TaxID=10195 RepID=A0A3M7S069_BRAPC|nr:hypothetical protein BpHYR1_002612 [Brachionus plicatilis]